MSKAASPLRYPGGKACLYEMTARLLRLNGLERGHYAEPYAGGCGLALNLLFGGHVAEVHVNDIDPAVWAFWQSVLFHTQDFIDLVLNTPITIESWHRNREINRNGEGAKVLALGFSTFFLNRTNRSGIIKDAGVIGGLTQTGNYKIDCRFNRDDLARRITRIARYRDQIHLTRLDAVDFLYHCEANLPEESLIFVDPPYFAKGSSLYTNFYKRSDHAHVADNVLDLSRPWVVTYDDVPEIRDLYQERDQFSFGINYSVQEKRVGSELLIVSDGLRVPAEFAGRRLLRVEREQAA